MFDFDKDQQLWRLAFGSAFLLCAVGMYIATGGFQEWAPARAIIVGATMCLAGIALVVLFFVRMR